MKILNAEPEGYSAQARDILNKIGEVTDGPLSREDLIKQIGAYDILIVRLDHKIDRDVLNATQNLKYIVTATTGLNHIDEKEAQQRGIKILSLKGETAFLETIHATAEHTWALLLALLRHIPIAASEVENGLWNRDAFKGHELHGKTIGIIGHGRIGRKIETYAKAFGMNVIIHDTKTKGASLDQALKEADIVTVHVSYDESSHHLIDAVKMKQGAVLINTSRGEIIDEDALLKALRTGRIAGAALDVLQGENSGQGDWAKTDKLIQYAAEHSNLVITPHLGGATYESMEKTEIFMARKLLDAL